MNVIDAIFLLILIAFFALIPILIRHLQKRAKIIHKGRIGERRVAQYFKKLRRKKYRVLNDILIRANGRSSQIDHIVVSTYGIFVIETKNYAGWIHGTEHAESWTQSTYRKKRKFRNPIIQNRGHINALRSTLKEFPYIRYYSIIVFTGNVKLKHVYCDTPVIYERKIKRTIRRLREKRILSKDQLTDIADKINAATITGNKVKRQHKQQVRETIRMQKKRKKQLICPRCKSELILRTGKYGQFYGCSNYPECNYIMKKH